MVSADILTCSRSAITVIVSGYKDSSRWIDVIHISLQYLQTKCKNRKSLLTNHTANTTDGCRDRTADDKK